MNMKTLRVSTEVRAAIRNSLIRVGQVFPPKHPISKEAYAEYKRVMEILEGTWVTGKNYFDFPFHVQLHRVLKRVVTTGEVPLRVQTYQEFLTPTDLADKMAALAIGQLASIDLIHPNKAMVLEPSAGRGAIIDALLRRSEIPWNWEINAVEIQGRNARAITDDPRVYVVNGDFLDQRPACGRYDAVLMNPPFARNAWLLHLEHAIKFLGKNGFLIAVVPSTANLPALTFIEDKSNVCIIPVPQFSFEGTNAKVSILTVGIKPDIAACYFSVPKEVTEFNAPDPKTPSRYIKSIRNHLVKALSELAALEDELRSKEEELPNGRIDFKKAISNIFSLYGEAVKKGGKLPKDQVQALMSDLFAIYRRETGEPSANVVKLRTLCKWAVTRGLTTDDEAVQLMAAYD
jgi:hypothetical protein